MRTRAAAKVALALASCLVGLASVEVALRLFLPKYEQLAETPAMADQRVPRFHVRIPNHRSTFQHPDTGEFHPFHHNNLGSRQHRDFSVADIESAVNIGFFGDSFTENAYMQAQFSFTEPLDYLLNDGEGKGQGKDALFNVLNFGMNGYSTAHSLLRYENLELRGTLDHVYYIFHQSDTSYVKGPFHLDDSGQLTWSGPRPSPFALLGRLHLTYLALDGAASLSPHIAAATADQPTERNTWQGIGNWPTKPDPYPLFRQLLRRFKAVSQRDGASFRLVRLPDNARFVVEAKIAAEEGVEIVDLQKCFAELDPAHSDTPFERSPYRFKRDRHWNEAGNRLTAVCLHRFMADTGSASPLPDHEVTRMLDRYYAAFEAQGGSANPAAAAIRAKYDALRDDGAADSRSVVTPAAPWAPSPDKLVAASHFDLYLHDGWLAYVLKDCRSKDLRERFFLHIYPRDLRDLPVRSLPSGFDNWDFDWFSRSSPLQVAPLHRHIGHPGPPGPVYRMNIPPTPAHLEGASEAMTCTAYQRLPDYAIECVRTGQFRAGESGDGDAASRQFWVAEHFLDGLEGSPPCVP